jgi:membrane associated rhomboid family serine protease
MTYLLIAITCVISILAFNNRELFARLQFNAYQIYHRKQYYRMLTHGFVHASWWHLFVNMFVLYFFGTSVEQILESLAEAEMLQFPVVTYLILYLAGIVFASTISLVRFKDDHWYNSVGASGAVSAIMFFTVFFQPLQKLYLYGLLGIPGILFAVAYLVYSQYMSRKGGDNINHDAHFLGAIFGFVFPLFIDIGLFRFFISQLTSFFG